MAVGDSKWEWDVFLSHSSKDKLLVRPLAERLEAAGYRVWYDEWTLVPGAPWQEALEEGLARSAHCAVCVGPNGFGPWHTEEMRQGVEQAIEGGGSRVIPILLPGVRTATRKALPKALTRLTWVDFSSIEDAHAFRRLRAGLDRKRPRDLEREGAGPRPAPSKFISPVQPPEPPLVVCPSWAAEAGRDQFGEWARVEVRNVSFRMRRIPAGTFWMGSPGDELGRYDDEGLRHQVTLSEDFWLGETPVTQALWRAVMGNSPSKFKGSERPVEQVSWDDVQEFLQSVAGHVPGLRLPTEAQWEYACRAGSEASRYGGLDAVAWYDGNSGLETHPVGVKHPNAWGLHDVLGNVWEWCHDYWHDSYDGSHATDPIGPHEGTYRVLRGGGWSVDARLVRAAYRLRSGPSPRYAIAGFRLSRDHSAPSR